MFIEVSLSIDEKLELKKYLKWFFLTQLYTFFINEIFFATDLLLSILMQHGHLCPTGRPIFSQFFFALSMIIDKKSVHLTMKSPLNFEWI